MKATSTNMVVTALGAAVSGIGLGLMRKMLRSRVGPGVLGFGLAHVALGLLDMNRPTVMDDELASDLDTVN